MLTLLAVAAAAYVAGSVNVAVVVLRLLGRPDPRDLHSGNPGTTNVYRVAGAPWAAVVLLLDVGRAAAVALLAVAVFGDGRVALAGLALVLGNCFPLFHGFRGGKGVATYLGFTAVAAPWGAAAGALAWVAVFAVTRQPFIGSFVMVLALAAGTLARWGLGLAALLGCGATVVLIFAGHRANVARWRRSS